MTQPLRFALNRMVAPHLPLADFLDLALALKIDGVELRNDLKGVEIEDGTPPEQVRELCEQRGIRLLSINALYPFDLWDEQRRQQLLRLAGYARACGAEGLVLCPLNDPGDRRGAGQRAQGLAAALTRIAEVLRQHGLRGFVEPLGFAECALRDKRSAVEAIRAVGALDVLSLVHDTFHHTLAGEPQLFAELTGLVHLSGIEGPPLPLAALRDGHRVLVGAADRLGNTTQIAALLAGGYRGYLSFEPFAASVHDRPDLQQALERSIQHLRQALA
ncbi:MAG: TIM barrel protein [Pseudomonas protegens]|nr:MAG: TIM barrel protein [Pseudomonas protegens]WEK23209.1 MAG: TIM barrel protein [Pseudomonas protegens]